MKRLTACLYFAWLAVFTQGQQAKNNTSAASLRQGVTLEDEEIKVLANDPHSTAFYLTTSWIPGEAHKGFVRYRIRAVPLAVDLKEAPSYIDRVHACSFTLNLYDEDNFVLRRVPLVFSRVLAESGDVTGLAANDMSQMDLNDYQHFLIKGNWQISWSC